MCSRSSIQPSLKPTSISCRPHVRSVEMSRQAASQTHGRLPRHISVDKLTFGEQTSDPSQGLLRSSPGPHSSIVWSYLISSFQQLSCFVFIAPVTPLVLYLLLPTAFPLKPCQIISHLFFDSTFFCILFSLNTTLYWKSNIIWKCDHHLTLLWEINTQIFFIFTFRFTLIHILCQCQYWTV